jgi:hypothetical protein
MCSNCQGDYENPDETAYELDADEPFVGYPQFESEADSRLHQLLASAHTVYCTINLVDHLYGRSPLVRSKRDMKVEGS